LGKPEKVLCGYEKTRELAPGEKQSLHFEINVNDLASYDDSGVTGHKSCYVLEAGEYKIYVGSDVRSAEEAFRFDITETRVTLQLTEAYAPVEKFDIIRNAGGRAEKISVHTAEFDMDKRRAENLPKEIPQTGDIGIKLADVLSGKSTMEKFIGQLSDDDLACIIRGEGMGSPQVTAGTAAAFGGVTESLRKFGIPCGCCDDGPSGMRLDCGTKAFSLPNGTMLACTFNKELITELFTFTGIEMSANNVECLLGPGMNIHRHPLNGRNFEYFSEDPYLTGTMAAAELAGLHKNGVTGTVKHFCGNNQETNRHSIDSVISERALREIYLKGFEIAIKKGGAKTVMTTYGSVNGLWTAGAYDLNTTILRGEWGFRGFVMTDWWADINERGKSQDRNNFAAMARAQNDVYMVCADSSQNTHGDNTAASLENGTLTRGELQRCAGNICGYLMNSRAMKRLLEEAEEIEIINRPQDTEDLDSGDVEFHKLDRVGVIPLGDVEAVKGKSFAFALDVVVPGKYRATITASAEGGAVAQVPVTLYAMGSPHGVYTFNGTGGEWASISRELPLFSRFTACRLYFGQSGITLRDIKFELINENFGW
ncbi:MAG: fibronectin type III-like domain-contianing protein, partial [Oscillospiraceae bacterium]|nr:fibronectin type III-like domain-contianing protein [Oscillospiraceae bacterium]